MILELFLESSLIGNRTTILRRKRRFTTSYSRDPELNFISYLSLIINNPFFSPNTASFSPQSKTKNSKLIGNIIQISISNPFVN